MGVLGSLFFFSFPFFFFRLIVCEYRLIDSLVGWYLGRSVLKRLRSSMKFMLFASVFCSRDRKSSFFVEIWFLFMWAINLLEYILLKNIFLPLFTCS